MSTWNENPYQASSAVYAPTAELADQWERTIFLRRTYLHLVLALGAFVGLEAAFFHLIPAEAIENIVGTLFRGWNWLLVLGAFMVVSWIAHAWAHSAVSLSVQYMGLALYVIAEAVIFVPLLFIADRFAPQAIPAAALMTGMIFGGLTLLVFVTRADFSWMGRYLCLAGFAALGLIVCSILFSFDLGVIFSSLMIVLAAGYILYDTSNVLHHYRTTQYVAASLALFASVALLFWYVLRILLEFYGRD